MLISARRRLTPLLVLVAVAGVAGCGSTATTSSGTSAPGGPGSGTQTTTSSAASTSSAPTTSGSASTSTSAPTGRSGECQAAQLALVYLGGQGATGHGDLGFALRNRSAHSCSTYGYPGIQFLDTTGKPLPTHATHSTDDFFGHLPLRALSVAPGQSVSFRLDVTHGSGSRGQCPTAAALQVIAPGDTRALSTTIGHGAYECGQAIVSPLAPGHSAHP